MRNNVKVIILIFILLITTVVLSSCGRSSGPVSYPEKSGVPGNSTAVSMELKLDENNRIERNITAGKGGVIRVNSVGKDVMFAFPKNSLVKDSIFLITPITNAPVANQKDVIVPGVRLEEKGKTESPKLKFPVILSFAIDGPLPEGAAIVKYYTDTKDYEVIPTLIRKEGSKTVLKAELKGLSDYGALVPEPGKTKRTKEKESDSIITVVDKVTKTQMGAYKTTWSVDMKATNSSGFVEGAFEGKMIMTIRTTYTGPGKEYVQQNLNSTVKDSNLKLSVIGIDPLTPENSEVPAYWRGEGVFNAPGKADVKYKNPKESGRFTREFEDGPMPFTIMINGSEVLLEIPGIGTFKGHMKLTGEEDFTPAPLTGEEDFTPAPLVN